MSHGRSNTAPALMVLYGAIFFLAAIQSPLAAESNPFAECAETNYLAAQKKFYANTNDATIAWEFGRACFDFAEAAKTDDRKAVIAEEGIAACRLSIALDPKSAPAHMYLGMLIGQVADTKRNLAALKMVKEIEHEFQVARELDEHFDSAGPDRNLGLLYLQSPPFISIGNRTKAKQHLLRAAKLAPDYPDNRLNLIHAYLKWNDREAARRELQVLEKIWPEAKKKYPDENWGALERRLEAAKTELEDPAK